MSQSLNDTLRNIVSNKWNDEFIVDAAYERFITYEKFFEDVLNTINQLKKLSGKDENYYIAIYSNGYNFLTLLMAILLENKTIIPIDPEKSVNEINEIISTLDGGMVVCEEEYYQLIETDKEKFVLNYNLSENSEPLKDKILELIQKIHFENESLITFTSGSTGKPKGVKHSFGNLVRSGLAFKEVFNFNKTHRFYHHLPMSYMAGILNSFILPLFSSSQLIIGERFNFKNCSRFWENPIKYQANVFWFTPTILAMLLKLDRNTEAKKYTSSSNILGLVGTAPLSSKIRDNFEEKYNIPLYESYGLSEFLFISTNSPNNTKDSTVGRLLDGVDITLKSDNEILVKTNWSFMGYYADDTEENNEIYYPTGDIGIIDKDKFLKITDRKKDIIIRGGINISPQKIENCVESFMGNGEFIVVGIPDELIGEKTVCFYDTEISSNGKIELKKLLIHELGRNYIIDEYCKVESIPKNINGKVDKNKLKELYEGAKYDSKD